MKGNNEARPNDNKRQTDGHFDRQICSERQTKTNIERQSQIKTNTDKQSQAQTQRHTEAKRTREGLTESDRHR